MTVADKGEVPERQTVIVRWLSLECFISKCPFGYLLLASYLQVGPAQPVSYFAVHFYVTVLVNYRVSFITLQQRVNLLFPSFESRLRRRKDCNV